jgi:hypothetical protein
MSPEPASIDRREAIKRVSFLLGGVSLVGGSALLTACERKGSEEQRAAATKGGVGQFTAQDVAFLDEVADTILPETKTPGAKAAKTGAFMALMVTDTYDDKQQQIFRDGMRKLDDASRKMNNAPFMSATPQQRLALLESVDKEAKSYSDAVDAARRRKGGKDTTRTLEEKKAEAHLESPRKEAAPGADVGPAVAITADSPAHYFRMMKELAMLGYFTSEIGCTKAQRYVESPGRFDPCAPYTPGEPAWAPHA